MRQEVKAKVQAEPWGRVRACAVSCGAHHVAFSCPIYW